MTEENMKLWNSVCKTDPSNTTKVEYGSRKFTSIDAYHQIKAATEEWGPYGIGWGIKEEAFCMLTGDMMIYTGVMFYPNGIVPVHSSIKTVDSKGKVDDECAKKAATDALTKGLSKLGFNADVFLGLFNDNRYVQQMKKEFTKATPNVISEDQKKTLHTKMNAAGITGPEEKVFFDSVLGDKKATADWAADFIQEFNPYLFIYQMGKIKALSTGNYYGALGSLGYTHAFQVEAKDRAEVLKAMEKLKEMGD